MTVKRQITLKSLAQKAHVDPSTVSRVLAGKAEEYRISKETRDRIRKLAKEYSYEPNQLARALREKRTYSIGIIIPDISNPFFSSITRSFEVESRKSGYSVIICDSQENTAVEKESLKMLVNRRVDGVIICPVGRESKHIEEVSKKNMPIVMVDRYFSSLNLPYVVSDNYNGSIQAITHFIENGHKRIGFIQGLTGSSVNEDRVRGYRKAHEIFGIPLDESLILGDSFGEENGYISAKILLSRTSRPTAIFAASNLISFGAMKAMAEEKLKIPDDISIIAFDDQPFSDYLATPMTTVSQQKEKLGTMAITLLLENINRKVVLDSHGIIIPTELIVRDSVKKIG